MLLEGIEFGLASLHLEGFIHGNLKCDKILIHYQEDGLIVPKLSDFGSSIILAYDVEFVEIFGTDPWRAPEVPSSRTH